MITNRQELEKFVNWLPELEDHERFFCAVFARTKYGAPKNAQLRKWLCRKENFTQRLEEFGNWKDYMAVYVNPNPRDLRGAGFSTISRLAAELQTGHFINPAAIAMSEIQKSRSRRWRFHFDIDGELPDLDFYDFTDVVKTAGGWHILVNPEIQKTKYANIFWDQINPHSDDRGDIMLPVPGCSQGGFTPYLRSGGYIKQVSGLHG